jgi:hypothetical protein
MAVTFLMAGADRVAAAVTGEVYSTSLGKGLDFRLWIPNGVEVIKGVIHCPPSTGGDERPWVHQRIWQAMAVGHGFALMGTNYQEDDGGPTTGGKRVFDALAAFAAASHHGELAHAPLCLHGFSQGAGFAYSFAMKNPERSIAFFFTGNGKVAATSTDASRQVPGMLFVGSADTPRRIENSWNLFADGRSGLAGRNALWSFGKQWGVAHVKGDYEKLALAFFDAVIPLRYPAGQTPLAGPVVLNRLTESSGWLGDPLDPSLQSDLPTIASYAAYAGNAATAAWFPNQAIAQAWRGLSKRPATITLRRPCPRASLMHEPGESIPLACDAAGWPGVTKIEFYADAVKIAESLSPTGSVWNASWSGAGTGVHSIIALATGPDQKMRTSENATVFVGAVGHGQTGQLIASEGFDYPTGSLAGQDGGVGFAGGWQTDATNGQAASVVAGKLTCTDVYGSTLRTLGGGSHAEGLLAPSTGTRRRLTATLSAGVVYLGFLARSGAAKAGDGLYLYNDATHACDFRRNYYINWCLVDGGDTSEISASPESDARDRTDFVVLRLDLGSAPGNDVMRWYLNPPPGPDEPGLSVHGGIASGARSYAFNALRLISHSPGGMAMDELRIGRTYADVAVPIANLAGASSPAAR